MKLGLKLSLLLLPLVAIPLLVVGSVSYVNLLKNAKIKLFSHVESTVVQVSRQIGNLVDNAQANANLFADNQQLKNYLLTADESIRYDLLYRPLQQEFIGFQKSFPHYYELRVILPDGFEDLRSVNQNIPNLTEDESQNINFQFISATEEPMFSRIGFNPDNGEVACFVYKRIELINEALDDPNAAPTLRGFFSLTASLNPIAKALNENALGTNGGLLLTNSSGQPLLAPAALAWIGDNQQQLKEHFNIHQSEDLSPLILAGQSFYSMHRQLSEDLWLHALLPEQTLLHDSRTIGKIVTQVTILALLGSLSLLLIVMRSQILKPMQALHNAVLRIGEGEELVQIEIDRDDELGQLGQEFNKMSLELKKSNDQIRNMAYCDNLTQLPNRFMFNRNLKRAIGISRKEKNQFALLYLDLIKFKQVNDTMGHLVGDQVLRDIANRLSSNLRGSDITSRSVSFPIDNENLARLGGDEFSILLPGINSSTDAAKIAERIISQIEEPIILNGKEHIVSVSIGIAVYPNDGDTAVELIKHADLAMYEAKKQGKGAYEFYSRKFSQQAHSRIRLEQRLLLAVENKSFELHYQPILDEKNLQISSLEALIRWTDEELGVVPPDKFIPVAEDMGLIHKIGHWVLTETCRQIKSWRKSGLKEIKVAINVSGQEFEKIDFADQVFQTLQKYKVSPTALHLELTESALIDADSSILANLEKLRRRKIKIALDDFGTGYSSLSYLRNLPIDILKIDRSFIQGLGQKNTGIILSAMITMAHALGLQVVAEGIEEQGQFAFLKKEKCDFLQGYLFSRPEPVDKISNKLIKNQLQPADLQDSNNIAL